MILKVAFFRLRTISGENITVSPIVSRGLLADVHVKIV